MTTSGSTPSLSESSSGRRSSRQPNVMPLVSVVTPVYNGEHYLTQCIESVLAQTYPNWEYTIVNNCSTDRTKEIADGYARKDSRIRVLDNQRFLNVMQNQNLAVRQMSEGSVYCKVLHADDWLFPDCLRQMVEIGEAYPTVGIVGAYRLDGIEVGCDGLPYPTSFISGRDLCRMTLLGGPGVFGSPTSLLFRSDCVRERNPMFEESDFHADTGACLDTLRTWDFGFVHQVLTYTRRHPGTQTSYATALNTFQAAEFRHLVRYGPVFLTPDEFQVCFDRVSARYWRFLAKSLSGPRAAEVWTYHRAAMAEAGHPPDRWKMLRAVVPFVGYGLRNPLAALRFGLRLLGVGRRDSGRASWKTTGREARAEE
jgi:glycosyltransferase involved in cell wall biosynthesis